MRGFPNISSKSIYENIIPKHKPTIESHYELYNWISIWKNVTSKCILLHERETIFKYLHEILPTKKRLKDIRQVPSATCDHCTNEESNIHIVYQCERYIDVINWFKNILRNVCGLRNPQLMKLLFLDIPKVNRKCKNVIIMLVSTYIVSMWQARKCNMNVNVTKSYIKGKLLQKIRQLKYVYGDSIENVLPTDICNMNWSQL